MCRSDVSVVCIISSFVFVLLVCVCGLGGGGGEVGGERATLAQKSHGGRMYY